MVHIRKTWVRVEGIDDISFRCGKCRNAEAGSDGENDGLFHCVVPLFAWSAYFVQFGRCCGRLSSHDVEINVAIEKPRERSLFAKIQLDWLVSNNDARD